MAVVRPVLAGVAGEPGHVHTVFLGPQPQLAVVEAQAAARQAAGTLVLDILPVEPRGHLREAPLALLHRLHMDLVAFALRDLSQLGPARLGPHVLADREGLPAWAPAQLSVDRLRRGPAVRDGVDDDCGTIVGDVAAREDAGDICLHRAGVHADGAPARGGGEALHACKALEQRGLPDRGNRHRAGQIELGAFERNRLPPAGGVRLAKLHPLAPQRLQLPALGHDPHRSGELEYLDALVQGVLYLHGVRRHLGLRPAVEDDDLVGREAPCRPRDVHGGVPAADDDDGALQGRLVEILLTEEVDAVDYPFRLELAGHLHGVAGPRARGDEDRVVAPAHLLEGHIAADCHGCPYLGARPADEVDLPVEHLVREPILRNAVAHHSAGLFHRLVEDGAIAMPAQEPGRGEAGRPGSDYPHGPPVVGHAVDRSVVHSGSVGHEALDSVYAHGAVDVSAAADDLALPDAHPSAYRRQGVGLPYEVHGPAELAHGSEGDVSLGIDAGGASRPARGDAVGVVIGQEQLQSRPARSQDALVAGIDLHALRNASRAGGHQVRPALHLHHADEAGSVGLELLGGAEGGDVVEVLLSNHFEDRLPRPGLHFLPVDLQCDAVHAAPLSLQHGAEVAAR